MSGLDTAVAICSILTAAIAVPGSVYAVITSRQSKRSNDLGQLVKDLTGDDNFCEKVVMIVVPSDKFRERAREVFTDRVQHMLNANHLVGGEFKENLRREIDQLRESIEGLRGEVRATVAAGVRDAILEIRKSQS